MSESTINTEILGDFYNDSLHDMFVLSNNMDEFDKTLNLLKSLCMKMDKYNNSFVLVENNNSYKKLKDKWQIDGYMDILKSLEIIELRFKELNAKIEMLDPIISNIDTSREELEEHVSDIENILSSDVVEKREVNFNDNISQNDVVNSINQNFIHNREVTNSFNKELYNRFNEKIVDLSSNKGN